MVAITRHTGHTQHSGLPVAKFDPRPAAPIPRAASDTAVMAAATRRSASSLTRSRAIALPPAAECLDALLELVQRGVHDDLLGLALEHAEHADRQFDLERVRHGRGAVPVVGDIVRA